MNSPRTTEKVYFCPKCVKPTVDVSRLAGSTATCRGCGWSGPQEELFVHEVAHEFASQGEALLLFSKELSLFLAQQAMPLGKILIKWGFLPNAPDRKLITRYILAATKGIATAVVEERACIEVEETVMAKARAKKRPNNVS